MGKNIYIYIYIKRCVLDISLIREAELKRILIGYLIEIFIKGRRRRPIRLSNKGGKYLTSNSLGVGLPYWRSCSLRHIGPRLYGSCDLYTVRLGYYRGLALI